ncbi:MAG: undecaprenyl-diphosphate phosphatase [Paracoccaceae bacterium]
MPILHILLVAVIQGITEFLPVSSSGHLILVPLFTGLPDQGLAIDVAVHVGTLFAVILYFRRDVGMCIAGVPRLLTGHIDTPGSRLAFLLIVATVPVLIAGAFLKLSGLIDLMRSMKVIGWTMILFGLFLYWADRRGPQDRHSGEWSIKDAVTLGLWQAVALIPGSSRSGLVISGARALGYDRSSAAKIAMLMSIPTIIASGVFLGVELVATADSAVLRDGLIAAAYSFVASLFALSLMMRLLRTISYTPYVIYRVILGLGLLWVAYS